MHLSRRRLMIGAVIVGSVLALGATAVAGWRRAHRPHLDAQARRSVPVVERYLATKPGGAWTGMPDAGSQRRARWLCTVAPIESAVHGDRMSMGVWATCGEYARQDDHLVTGAGYASPIRVTLVGHGGAWTARHAEHPDLGAGFAPSIRRMFTADGARVALDMSGGPYPGSDAKARAVFGLPAEAPVTPG